MKPRAMRCNVPSCSEIPQQPQQQQQQREMELAVRHQSAMLQRDG